MIKIGTTKKDTYSDLKIGLFAESGAGKTSLIKTLPHKKESDVAVLDIEGGLTVLKKYNFGRIGWNEHIEIPEPSEKIKELGEAAIEVYYADPLTKMREVFAMLNSKDFLENHEWFVMDSFSKFGGLLKAHLEKYYIYYGLVTKSGVYDIRSMYGLIKNKFIAVNDAILSVEGINKLILFGAHTDDEGAERKIELLIDGSFSESVMHEYDEFYGIKVEKKDNDIIRSIVTGHDGAFVAKSRSSGGAGDCLDLYEPMDLSSIINKCYPNNKEKK